MNATAPKRKKNRTRKKNNHSFSQRLWILTFFLLAAVYYRLTATFKAALGLHCLLILLFVGNGLMAQTIDWAQTYGGSAGDYANSISPTGDGGYIFAGGTISGDGDITSGNQGGRDVWAVKLDSDGIIAWEQTYGGSSDDYAYSISPTSDGGYILAGYTYSNDGDITSGNQGDSDVWVVKLDSNGTIDWEQTYGGSADEVAHSMSSTADGGYILAGSTSSDDGDITSGNQGGTDVWVVKLNSDGSIAWEQTYGGSADDVANSISPTGDGGYILAGSTSSDDGDITSGNQGDLDVWVVKLESDGSLAWEQTYGGSVIDLAQSITPTADGGYILTGRTFSNNGDITSGNQGGSDVWVVKLDSDGNIAWEQTYGGSGFDFATSISPTGNGGYILAGSTGSNNGDITSGNQGLDDVWVIKLKLTIAPDANNILYVNQEVNQTATGYQPTGSSWENALPELRDALNWAATGWDATTGTLQIWVAQGIYTPTAVATDRDATFQLVNSVEIYGGFAGNEPAAYDLDLRDFATNTSILSGDIDGNDGAEIITAPNTQIQGNNSYTVVNGSGTDNTALLDGFTITAGYAQTCNTTVNTPGCSGAGVYTNQGSPALSNTFISGNRAAIYGGGMYNTSNSSPALTNVEISNNTAANHGGGMYNTSNASPSLVNVGISNNTADHNGGGMYNQSSSPGLTNASISGNTASTGGSEWHNASGIPVIRNSIIFGNGVAGQLSDTEYSLVQDQNDYSGTGNIDATGLTATAIFTNPINGDFTLKNTSPAINAGDNSAYPGDLQNDLDLAGNPRVFDGEPDDDIIDMGAYEFQGEPFIISPTNGILYVNISVDGTGSNFTGDGSSWENALPELADALLWARQQHVVDNNWLQNDSLQIWVAQGTYKPLYNAADGSYDQNGDRDNAFVMVKNVQMYGGFPDSGNPTVTDRDWENNPTVLSGDLDEDEQLSGGDAYHVLIAANDVGNALVDGFTLTGGNANSGATIIVNGQNITSFNGGGIHKYNSSLSLTNTTLSGNSGDDGGGIFNFSGTVTLTNSTLSGNSAFSGGGIFNNSGTVTLTNSTLSGNSAFSGGGIFNNSGTVTLTNSTLSDNSGGGIFNEGSGIVTLTNSTLSGNSGDGGIYNEGTVTLTNSTLSDNSGGAGIYNEGTLTLTNSTLSDNSGGGINNSGTVTLTNSTLSGNSAGGGGGIRNTGTLTLTNSLIANSPSGGDCFNFSGVGNVNDNGHNLVEDGSCITVGSNGNLSGDPLLGPLADNGGPTQTHALLSGSPAIDAGSNPMGLVFDQRGSGFAREVNGSADIGAFEFQGEPFGITLTLAEGWRMLSSPVDGLTYDDMLGDLWTQGFPGSDYEGDANTFPNVYIWDTAYDGTCLEGDPCPGWVAPSAGFGNPIPPGSGFLMYVYRDDEYGQQPEGQFPKTLVLSGLPPTGDVSPQMNTHGDGWTLAGNPYSVPVSFDDLAKVNLTNAAYVYDPNLSGVGDPGPVGDNEGGWRTTVGLYGDLTDGIIAPGQGFFVQNTSTTPSSLTFTEGSKTTGGDFYGKEKELRDYVRLEVQGESLYNSVWIRFSDDGSLDQTTGEALELQPLGANYAMLGTRKADGVLMDIAHYPLNSRKLEIPLAVEATRSGNYTLRATDLDLPAGMALYLHDRQTGESMPIGDTSFEYSFSLTADEPKKKTLTATEILAAGAVGPNKATTTGTDRFVITTSPGGLESELPHEVALGQNYPNPFNPATVIRYQLPVSSEVRLEVYDMLGRKVATLVDSQVAAGTHQVSFDAGNLSSGVYLYRLTALGSGGSQQIITKKLTLIK